jgi:hypothetical protein
MACDTAAVDSLRGGLASKGREAETLKAEIEAAQLEARMLRLSLLVHGVKDESVIPAGLRSGGGGSLDDPMGKFLEHKRLLEWLAENCDLKSRRTCNVVGDLCVNGSRAVIGHAVQWSISGKADLSFTIPMHLESTVVSLLIAAQRSILDLEHLEIFASEYDMLSVEMSCEGDTMPGLFLIRRQDSAAMVISAWPKLPSPTSACRSRCFDFDPTKYFTESFDSTDVAASISFSGSDGFRNTLVFGDGGAVRWCHEERGVLETAEIGISFRMCGAPDYECFTLRGPFGEVQILDPPAGEAQRELVREIVSLSVESDIKVSHAALQRLEASKSVNTVSRASSLPAMRRLTKVSAVTQTAATPTSASTTSPTSIATAKILEPLPGLPVSKGDSVEVQHEGQWLPGVLQEVKGEFALVSCDSENPDIVIVAPLRQVRSASYRERRSHSVNKSVSQ